MNIQLIKQETGLQYKAVSELATIEIGANQFNFNEGKTFRPMELILAGLASCSAIDIENILTKQKIAIKEMIINVHGHRVNKIPAVFDKIDIEIIISGLIPENKLQRAIELTKEKYCSVYSMLKETVTIEYNYKIINN